MLNNNFQKIVLLKRIGGSRYKTHQPGANQTNHQIYLVLASQLFQGVGIRVDPLFLLISTYLDPILSIYSTLEFEHSNWLIEDSLPSANISKEANTALSQTRKCSIECQFANHCCKKLCNEYAQKEAGVGPYLKKQIG